MKRTLLILFLLLPFALSGQSRFPISNSAHLSAAAPGGEMLSQADFSSVSDWTLGVGFSHDAGNEEVDYDATSSNMYQLDGDMLSSVQASTDYTFEVVITATGFKCDIYLFDSGGTEYYNAQITNTGTGTFSVDFTTPSDIGDGGLLIVGGAFTYTMSSVSLTER